MFDLKTQHDVDIYVSTLFALARDAAKQNQDDAYLFIAKYLHGLAPDADIEAMHNEHYPEEIALPAPPPPAPRPEPEQPKAAPQLIYQRRVPRQSPTLAW